MAKKIKNELPIDTIKFGDEKVLLDVLLFSFNNVVVFGVIKQDPILTNVMKDGRKLGRMTVTEDTGYSCASSDHPAINDSTIYLRGTSKRHDALQTYICSSPECADNLVRKAIKAIELYVKTYGVSTPSSTESS
ncbi:MAG: hypothetical protein HC877_23130 [Thioploca sp.]|nr:hypothetical protein [Thioploca sp.]